jgi:hypothetical protein
MRLGVGGTLDFSPYPSSYQKRIFQKIIRCREMSGKYQKLISEIETVNILKCEIRQRTVFELRLTGLTQEKVAKILRVNVKTVERDEKEIEQKQKIWFRKAIKKFDIARYWLKQIEELILVKRELWATYAKGDARDRVKALETIVEIQKEIEQRMRSAGVKTLATDTENDTNSVRLSTDIRKAINKIYGTKEETN